MSDNELVDVKGARALYKDLRGRIPPPVEVPVADVQVDGTSILDDGIANIPIAAWNRIGVVKPNPDYGIGVYGSNATKSILYITTPTDAELKAGSNQYKAVKVIDQHKSIFYGLSKAAGVDLANETVTLGQYPDSAKVAIQKMLGVYEAPWELIRNDTFTNAELGDYAVNTDSYGQYFELTDVIVQIIVPANSETTISNYGIVQLFFGNGNDDYHSALLTNFTGPKSHAWYGSLHYRQDKNAYTLGVYPFSESGNNRNFAIRNQMDLTIVNETIKKVVFKSVLGRIDYKIYGKRKWS